MCFHFHPLTPDRWPDLERLFGPSGACGGCWCMWWRLPRAQFTANKGEPNRQALRQLVCDNARVPGILAYDGSTPAGWCAVEPRQAYPNLARARTLKPVDDQPVWSVTCLFIAKPYRRQGLSAKILAAAAEHVQRLGGRIVEGYPVQPKPGSKTADPFVWTGLPSAFLQAGFVEVARPSPSRRIMRRQLADR